MQELSAAQAHRVLQTFNIAMLWNADMRIASPNLATHALIIHPLTFVPEQSCALMDYLDSYDQGVLQCVLIKVIFDTAWIIKRNDFSYRHVH